MCDGWFFFFKQKTAYEMRISDWSSDVCSSDLQVISGDQLAKHLGNEADSKRFRQTVRETMQIVSAVYPNANVDLSGRKVVLHPSPAPMERKLVGPHLRLIGAAADETALRSSVKGRREPAVAAAKDAEPLLGFPRSEEHTSELQSLMRISYAVFCLKKKKN